MAKKQYLNEKKLQQELFKRTEGYAYSVRAHYIDAFNQVINLVKGTELEEGKPFNFADYGYSEQVTPILRQMYSRVYQTIRGGVQAEWLKSNEHTDDLVKAVFGAKSIEDHHFARFFHRNMAAMDAFFARKSADGGLNLSQRVWKYVSPYKEELESTLDLAIGEGTPAMQLASKVKEYLNDPDRWYRRFRYKVGEDENGKPIYGLKWKRRVFDKQSGLYNWIDDDPKHYHPGKGVYRSSARNAQRLARTETNIAYRTADYERWQQLDFVIGMRVRLSNNHPVTDICDLMADKLFPKDFKWTGWHPNCRCYMVPVLATEEDMDTMLDNILDGKEPTEGVPLEGKVTEMPKEFGYWIKANEERMEAARERGTLPYFIKDNEQRITDALNGKQPVKKPLSKKAKDRRKVIKQLAVETLVWKQFALPQIGKFATISNRGVKEWLNQPFYDVEAKNEALLDLPNLIENAVYCGSGVDKHFQEVTLHLFETSIGGRKCWIVVRQNHTGEYLIYSMSDNETILKAIQ